MNNLLVFFIFFGLFISCNSKTPKEQTSESIEQFTIDGTCSNKEEQIVYLFIIKDTVLTLLDSASVDNDKFQIKNTVSRPLKALIKIKDHHTAFPFILTNEIIEIELNENNSEESTVKNSPINEEFANLRKQSMSIFQKIDYLFPQLQKARMENDSKTLEEINTKINGIEKENKAFIIKYIQQNPDKHLPALLLNDLWNSPDRDSTQLQKLARNLAPEIQKTLEFTIH